MSADRFLLDTAYVQALLNRRDAHHTEAQLLFPRVRAAQTVVVTEVVRDRQHPRSVASR